MTDLRGNLAARRLPTTVLPLPVPPEINHTVTHERGDRSCPQRRLLPHPRRRARPRTDPPSNDHTGGVILVTLCRDQDSRTAIADTLIPPVLTVAWPLTVVTGDAGVAQTSVDPRTAATHSPRSARR